MKRKLSLSFLKENLKLYIFVIVEQKHLTFTDSVVGETLAHGS